MPTRRNRSRAPLVLPAALALALTPLGACSGDDDGGDGSASSASASTTNSTSATTSAATSQTSTTAGSATASGSSSTTSSTDATTDDTTGETSTGSTTATTDDSTSATTGTLTTASTGTSDSGSTSGTTGEPGVCDPVPGEDPCETCAKENCCDELMACQGVEDCECMSECYVNEKDISSCGQQCVDGVASQEFQDLLVCVMPWCGLQTRDMACVP